MTDSAGTKPWDEAMSGWRSNFVSAPTQLREQRTTLLSLVGRQLRVGWTAWVSARDEWVSDIPLVLVFDGDVQLEIAWQRWDALSITWNTIDLTIPPTILGRPFAWRPSAPEPVAAVAGRTLTGWAATESPYFAGDADLAGRLPMDQVAGWSIEGLWIEFADAGLHVYNGADTNGLSSRPIRPGDDGHTRVTHRQLPEHDEHTA